MRVKNFMRELGLKQTNWEENIVALSKKGSMSVEEFLATDPITFGEKIWGKDDWKYTNGYPRVQKLVGEWTYYKMWRYYENTPAQRAEKAYKDAKVAAIKKQEALGLTSWHGVRAEDKAGWEYVFAENKAAEEKAAAEQEAREAAHAAEKAAAEQEAREAAHAAEKARRYDAAVEAHEQVVADEEQAKLSKEAVEAVTKGWAQRAVEDRAFAYQQVAAWEAMDARAAQAEPKEVESEWICQTCTAVWRTKTKVE
jgi:hypothetical protein